MSINMNEKDKKAFIAGRNVGELTIYYEILNLRNKCEYPEELEAAIDLWLERFEKFRMEGGDKSDKNNPDNRV